MQFRVEGIEIKLFHLKIIRAETETLKTIILNKNCIHNIELS